MGGSGAGAAAPICQPQRGLRSRLLSSVTLAWPGGKLGTRSYAKAALQSTPGGSGSATQGPGRPPLQASWPAARGHPGVGEGKVHATDVAGGSQGNVTCQQTFQPRLFVRQVFVSWEIWPPLLFPCTAVTTFAPVEKSKISWKEIGCCPNSAEGI